MVLNFFRIFNNNIIFQKYHYYYFIVKIVLSLLKFIYLFLFLKNLGSHAVSYHCVCGPRAFSQVERITVLWRVLAGFGRGAVGCGTVMQEQDLSMTIFLKGKKSWAFPVFGCKKGQEKDNNSRFYIPRSGLEIWSSTALKFLTIVERKAEDLWTHTFTFIDRVWKCRNSVMIRRSMGRLSLDIYWKIPGVFSGNSLVQFSWMFIRKN